MPGAGDRVVRVLPDVAALNKQFDYVIPAAMSGGALASVGTQVRIDLHGRRVGGWITAVDPPPHPDVTLRPISKVRGLGPPVDVIALAHWAAWRWGGRVVPVLTQASPPTAVRHLPLVSAWLAPEALDQVAEEICVCHDGPGVRVLQWGPTRDPFPIVVAAARLAAASIAAGEGCGGALIVTPSTVMAERLARRLRRSGVPTALMPEDWALAAAGGVVAIGARAAVWAPVERPAVIVVLDEHDEALREERQPCWHARDVAIERARRLDIPCVLVSSQPTLEARSSRTSWREGDRFSSLSLHDSGGVTVNVVDRRAEEPGRHGLIAPRTAELIRTADRAICVLNRTGQARLLVCARCQEIARCEACAGACALAERAGPLRCQQCGTERPIMCGSCGSAKLKNARPGVSRLAEDLAVLVNRPVGEVTALTVDVPDDAVLVGTEAVLHRVERAALVVFVDFDSELFAPRLRAAEQSLALLGRASRIVRGRRSGDEAGVVVVQTRVPDDPVIEAARLGDPSRIDEVEIARRRLARAAPFGHVAMISGPGASEVAAIVAALGRAVEVRGSDGSYRLRADDVATLCDALRDAGRPVERVRIDVDPLR